MLRRVVLGVVSIMMPGFLWGTTFIIKTDEQKIIEANRICAVKVLSLTPQELNGIISTVGRVRPIKCFKDSTTEDFDISWPGGSLEGMNASGKLIRRKTSVPGTPDLKVDQTAVLYLSKAKRSANYLVYGWSQGVTPIYWDAESKQYMMGARKPTRARSPKDTTRDLETQNLQSLNHLKERIDSVLQSRGR